MDAALELRGITKRFGRTVANDGVDFDLRAGEVHALLGENGAGKSTLVKILTGLHAPDSGTILRDGEPVEFANVRVANRAGIVALYQELSIISSVSVAENILLGEQTPSRGGFVQWATLKRRAQEQLDKLHQRIPLLRQSGKL